VPDSATDFFGLNAGAETCDSVSLIKLLKSRTQSSAGLQTGCRAGVLARTRIKLVILTLNVAEGPAFALAL
jgi:hypothetical protein